MTPRDEVATADQLETIRSIMKGVRICMMTSTAADGSLHSHPMTTQDAEFDGDCWFIASDASDTVRQLADDAAVNLAYAGSSSWLSLAGSARVVRDQTKKEELWNTFTDAWYPDGEQDPSVVLLHIEVHTAQYWDSPGKLATMAGMIKAKVTGSRPKSGETNAVDL